MRGDRNVPVGLVLLAAGRGTRFGAAPKLLARLDGKPLVRHAAEAALASRARPVIAVLGAHEEAVGASLDGLDLHRVPNPAYAEGLSGSLRAGLAALPPNTRAAIVMLGDMPRITATHLDALIAAYRLAQGCTCAVVPVSGGRRGNPVLLDLDRLGGDLAALQGDRGAGAILAARDDVLEIATDEAVAFDVDTPEALPRG
ncbi:nucleotidyltransferase family protein [Methylobacterium organophilum]|uniref:nucleotidyltransferase family protein n=1 Tax=Methylobacterium organophilum TaxID=410 RepID=UPI001F148627|nr:nucleotidyltransferase family protein [Methylobacterium organophilum]UMY15716.1 nucleotidyltransferase family protein [Methylobacterium organophilum]